MIKADLHIHSTFSDGSVSIPEIIDMALAAGLEAAQSELLRAM